MRTLVSSFTASSCSSVLHLRRLGAAKLIGHGFTKSNKGAEFWGRGLRRAAQGQARSRRGDGLDRCSEARRAHHPGRPVALSSMAGPLRRRSVDMADWHAVLSLQRPLRVLCGAIQRANDSRPWQRDATADPAAVGVWHHLDRQDSHTAAMARLRWLWPGTTRLGWFITGAFSALGAWTSPILIDARRRKLLSSPKAPMRDDPRVHSIESRE